MVDTAKAMRLRKGSPELRMAEYGPARRVTAAILTLGWLLAWGLLWSDEYADMLDDSPWAFPLLTALAVIVGAVAARTIEPPARSHRRFAFAFTGTMLLVIAFAITGSAAMGIVGPFMFELRIQALPLNLVIITGLLFGGILMSLGLSLFLRSSYIARRGLIASALAAAVSAAILLCLSAAGADLFGACELCITAGAVVWSVALSQGLLRDARQSWDEPWIRRRCEAGFAGERCWRCYYDMRRTEVDRCSECGAMVMLQADQ